MVMYQTNSFISELNMKAVYVSVTVHSYRSDS